MSRRRILVTGAAGLIGEALLPALRLTSDEIIPLDRSACELSDPDAARRAVAAIRPEVVVHLAGGTAADPGELYRDNVLATVHLLEALACLETRPWCLVFGSAAEHTPVTEYGRAKRAQTTLAAWLAGARGIPLTILRPFNIVSHRLPAASALGNMRRQLLAGEGRERSVRCGRLDIVRDFVPLADVVEAVRRLLARPAPGEMAGQAIDVCSGAGIALGEILAAMGRRLEVNVRIVPDPDLGAIPAPPRVVGDPAALLAAVGLAITPTAESLAALLLEDQSKISA